MAFADTRIGLHPGTGGGGGFIVVQDPTTVVGGAGGIRNASYWSASVRNALAAEHRKRYDAMVDFIRAQSQDPVSDGVAGVTIGQGGGGAGGRFTVSAAGIIGYHNGT